LFYGHELEITGKKSAEMLSDRSPFVMCCGGMLSES
jgi:hypothetical protein